MRTTLMMLLVKILKRRKRCSVRRRRILTPRNWTLLGGLTPGKVTQMLKKIVFEKLSIGIAGTQILGGGQRGKKSLICL